MKTYSLNLTAEQIADISGGASLLGLTIDAALALPEAYLAELIARLTAPRRVKTDAELRAAAFAVADRLAGKSSPQA